MGRATPGYRRPRRLPNICPVRVGVLIAIGGALLVVARLVTVPVTVG